MLKKDNMLFVIHTHGGMGVALPSCASMCERDYLRHIGLVLWEVDLALIWLQQYCILINYEASSIFFVFAFARSSSVSVSIHREIVCWSVEWQASL